MDNPPYARRRVVWFDPEREEDPLPEEITRLDDFEEVVAFLKQTYI